MNVHAAHSRNSAHRTSWLRRSAHSTVVRAAYAERAPVGRAALACEAGGGAGGDPAARRGNAVTRRRKGHGLDQACAGRSARLAGAVPAARRGQLARVGTGRDMDRCGRRVKPPPRRLANGELVAAGTVRGGHPSRRAGGRRSARHAALGAGATGGERCAVVSADDGSPRRVLVRPHAVRVVADDGTGDRLLARHVAAVAPSWQPGHRRTGSAYVTPNGSVVVRRCRHAARDLVRKARPEGRSARAHLGQLTAPSCSSPAPRPAQTYNQHGQPVASVSAPPGTPILDAPLAPAGGALALVRGGAADDVAWSCSRSMLHPAAKQRRVLVGSRPASARVVARRAMALLVSWPAADQLVFVRVAGRPRIAAASRIATQVRHARERGRQQPPHSQALRAGAAPRFRPPRADQRLQPARTPPGFAVSPRERSGGRSSMAMWAIEPSDQGRR